MDLGTEVNPITITKENVVENMERLARVLDEAAADDFWLVMGPVLNEKLRRRLILNKRARARKRKQNEKRKAKTA